MIERCSQCKQDVHFTYDDLCISCLWDKLHIKVEKQVCTNCHISKPITQFHSRDSACALCRKLIVLGLHYKSKFSKMLSIKNIWQTTNNEVQCKSCHTLVSITDLPENSFECWKCFGVRNLTELQYHIHLEGNIKCLLCGDVKPMIEYPVGRLACNPCLLRIYKVCKK